MEIMTNRNLPAVIQDDSSFQRYLQEAHSMPILSADEEYMLAKRWTEHGDYDAAHKLVTSHLRLVAKMAMSFKGYGLPLMDMVAEGNIGLMQAVKKFDPDKGFRLSTYAMWWIRAAIQEYILRSWSLVKVGSSATQKRLFFNLKRLKNRLQALEGYQNLTPETISEIAKELNVNEEDVVDMDNLMIASDQRLDAPIGGNDSINDNGGTWVDLLPAPDESQADILEKKEETNIRRQLLKDAMNILNDREKDIIEKRRMTEPAVTLEELSKTYNISKERVRQIENRAMEKLTAEVDRLQNMSKLPATTSTGLKVPAPVANK